MKIVLRYTGGGHEGALIGVPARDLSAEELEELGLSAERLVSSGLYELTEVIPASDGAGNDVKVRRPRRKGDEA